MRSVSEPGCSWNVISDLYAELLSEFQVYLQQAGTAENSIRLYLGTARHFLAWLKADGIELEAIDDAVLLAFRDHDCHCFLSTQGFPWAKREPGLGKTSMLQAIRFVNFLESSGKTWHPGEIQLGIQYLEDYSEQCSKLGYRARTLRDLQFYIQHFLVWLHRTRTPIKAISLNTIESFLSHDCLCHNYALTPNKLRRAKTCESTVRDFANYLAEQGVASAAALKLQKRKPRKLNAFCIWLEQHRGISASTIEEHDRYASIVVGNLGTDASQYDAALVRQVLLREFANCSVGRAKAIAGSTRMYLRFLASTGACSPGLVNSVPSPAFWRLSTLPRYIPMKDVERVIASCDVNTPGGVRDRAILLLLARLGLRAGDICELGLSDIDWVNAEIHVCGKTRRSVALPLPQDVGDALLHYIGTVRPSAATPCVFLCQAAPHRPFADSSAVSMIVAAALKRAGIHRPRGRGAHLLRHSLATDMLRSGASMDTIGTLLRHKSRETTAIYAKVDVPMLESVAQTWIGGDR